MRYKVGQLVVNTKLGLGKVLHVKGNYVTVFFKDQTENPRIINVAVMPMEVPQEQSDACLDDPNMQKKQRRTLTSKKKAAKKSITKAKQP